LYAIIETGGKQYKVQPGDIITVEKLNLDAGVAYTFNSVLAVGDGEESNFGKPYVTGAAVTATIIGDGKGKKVIAYKRKAKKGYKRKQGHRQPFTRLKIETVSQA
jgi:large subunit ribosomal protein L21